ncbi:MAG TPA: DUF4870 domain-containing protein [Candidatus Rubrimentiphilum sp.]|nr:DUF4870 domain-containing protein [Candidatus Rubrimentiphilum sp.]
MDCYFHANVPSIARCSDCSKAVCATCRDQAGTCPSCRLAAKIDSANAQRKSVAGQVPPRSQQWWNAAQQQPAPQARATVAEASDPGESRALVAMGYPLWPLALISLFDRKQSRRLRKHAYQALGFNVGMAGLWGLLTLLAGVPILGISAAIVLAFIIPIFVVMSVYYGIKAWHGDDVRVPVISDWIDDRLPA